MQKQTGMMILHVFGWKIGFYWSNLVLRLWAVAAVLVVGVHEGELMSEHEASHEHVREMAQCCSKV